MKHTFTLLTALLLAPLAALQAGDDGPIVGAIRWDAWCGDGSVTKAVESSLGQPKYHFRLPWFARVVGEGKVSINGDSQVIIEQEITHAAQAGLNYWAFLDYLDEAPGMSIALNRYLLRRTRKASATASSKKVRGSTERARKFGAGSWSTSGIPITKPCSMAARCCLCL